MKLTRIIPLLTAAAFSFSLINAADSKAPEGVPASYPLKKCVISDDPLGEMGNPVKVTYEDTDVYLCCKSCVKDFKKDPARYVKMVKDAAAKKK